MAAVSAIWSIVVCSKPCSRKRFMATLVISAYTA
jgi:hypothetical protein